MSKLKCAFVQFVKRQGAENAAAKTINNCVVRGRVLRVQWGRSKKNGGGGEGETPDLPPVPAAAPPASHAQHYQQQQRQFQHPQPPSTQQAPPAVTATAAPPSQPHLQHPHPPPTLPIDPLDAFLDMPFALPPPPGSGNIVYPSMRS